MNYRHITCRDRTDITVITVEYYSIDDVICLAESLWKFEPSVSLVVASNSGYDIGRMSEFYDRLDNIKRDREHARLTVFDTGRNGGYSFGVNEAMRHVDSEIVALLNPDTRITGTFSEKAVMNFFKDDRLGVFSPHVVDKNGTTSTVLRKDATLLGLIDRIIVNILKRHAPRGSYKRNLCNTYFRESIDSESSYVDSVSGGVMFFNFHAFMHANGFDERYFLYMEDADFCRTIRKYGWKVKYIPNFTIMHYARHASTSGRSLVNPLGMLSRERRAHLISYIKYFWKWR